MNLRATTAAFIVATSLALGAAPAFADFTTIDISSYVNANISASPQTYPVGTTTGNQGTGTPFNVATFGQYAGSWIAESSQTGVLSIDLTSMNITGQASFYALLNNYYGSEGENEYTITISATDGSSVTYDAIGGQDTRDYNASSYTNNVSSAIKPWFDNGIGQRLDLREFSLPGSFASKTLGAFTITQVHYMDSAVFTGVTFSDVPLASAAAPEPGSIALLLTAGIPVVGIVRRRKSMKMSMKMSV